MTPSWFLVYRERLIAALDDVVRGDGLLIAALRFHLGLSDEGGRATEAPGKLIRPSLALYATEALGGRAQDALPAAVALELVHNFSLVHDDIQDRDRTRRGRPTLWTRVGIEQAINAGDLLHALAAREAARCGEAAAGSLADATIRMIEGQALDLDLETRRGTPDDVLAMIDRKTGALLCCALDLGAIVAGSSGTVREALAGAGRAIGRAFQIQDDVLGVWGDMEELGKPIGSDVRRRKTSYPIAIAFARADGVDAAELARIYGKAEMSDGDVASVVSCMTRLGIREECAGAVSGYVAEAKLRLADARLAPDRAEGLEELLTYLCGRSM